MIPFGNDTVTLIRRTQKETDGKRYAVYTRHMLHGCSWRRKISWRGFDTERTLVNEITCRIPANNPRPNAGDCLFLGEISDEITDSRSLNAAINAHRESGAFRITTVSDNTRPGMPLPHFSAFGEG